MRLSTIKECFDEHAKVLNETRDLFPTIAEMAEICRLSLSRGNKILICGNGGSAADAQHIAAEFVGRFHKERCSLAAVALNTDTSILTSVANDYDFSDIFARQVDGIGQEGDVLWGISTSGNSENVNKAIRAAKDKKMMTIASTGYSGGELAKHADVSLVIPSQITARIQEMHILCAHIICQLIDDLEWDK